MSDIIRLLPDSVANQIAAGEVIQRPASVVKELVENSVDAGAKNIQIIIKDAGRTLIQVVDNGKGMSMTDARMAFERHATSKITRANDLFALHTMGFRGEALASIAAVAQIEMTTMRQEDQLGTQIRINGSKVEGQEPCACSVGTNLKVKNLFFNVPARRKFLKKDTVELSNIVHEFERLALVNPSIELTLVHNDTILHQLLGTSLKQRIGDLFGKGMEKQLIPVATETSIVKVSGFVGLPENARKRGALQYLFVNGRNMRHPYFHKAIMHCYSELIKQDEQPNYFLNFEVDPSTIDVNIHPTKHEIKFENEQAIWQILVAAIRQALGQYNAIPAMDFNSMDELDIPAFNPGMAHSSDFSGDTQYNPFEQESNQCGAQAPSRAYNPGREARAAVSNWDLLYRQFQSGVEIPSQPALDAFAAGNTSGLTGDKSIGVGSELALDADDLGNVAPTMMQLKNKYILSQAREGLMLIDQHRAHFTVLFDKYNRTEVNIQTQKVMFPETLTLAPADNAVLTAILPQIERNGFELAYLGDNVWAINGVPSIAGIDNFEELLRSIIADLSEGVGDNEAVRRQIILKMAQKGAIKYGQALTTEEMEHLVGELFSIYNPVYTPDGMKIVLEISLDEIEKRF